MTQIILTARLRATIRKQLGGAVLTALETHMALVQDGKFDATANWQITQILELSELAHRLRDTAEALPSTNPMKIEAARLAKLIMTQFWDVYETAMRRVKASPQLPRERGEE